MRIAVFLFLALLITGCANNAPKKNPLTQNNLHEYNSSGKALVEAVYSPEFPNPVKKDHPLYKAVRLGTISGIPDVIRNINIAVASSGQFKEALRETLRESNLLSEHEKNAEYILDAVYKEPDTLALQAVFYYQLREKGVTLPLFNRDFTSLVTVRNWWGGMTYLHARTAKQFSLMLNISSLTWCLEQYDGTSFPDDCNLVFVTPEQLKTKSFGPEDVNKITASD